MLGANLSDASVFVCQTFDEERDHADDYGAHATCQDNQKKIAHVRGDAEDAHSFPTSAKRPFCGSLGSSRACPQIKSGSFKPACQIRMSFLAINSAARRPTSSHESGSRKCSRRKPKKLRYTAPVGEVYLAIVQPGPLRMRLRRKKAARSGRLSQPYHRSR